MFHRPKPETQNETASSGMDSVLDKQIKPSSASPVSVVASNMDTSTDGTPQVTMDLKSKNEKDTSTMTSDQDRKTTEQGSNKSVDIPQTTTSSPFQRPAAANSSKSYGSYNPTPYAPGTNPVAGASGNGRRLVIGEGITMSGEIESCDHLLVEGSVEAALKGAKVLEISETGKFYGTVEIEEATIAGHFEGEVNVSGRLTVASTGVITGSIVYGELQIEAGATLDGRLAPMANASTAKKGKPAKKKADTELPLVS